MSKLEEKLEENKLMDGFDPGKVYVIDIGDNIQITIVPYRGQPMVSASAVDFTFDEALDIISEWCKQNIEYGEDSLFRMRTNEPKGGQRKLKELYD